MVSVPGYRSRLGPRRLAAFLRRAILRSVAHRTRIEWTDSTFNPVIGCTKVSEGCANCYAAALAARYRWVRWGPQAAGGTRRRTAPAGWARVVAWDRAARAAGRRRRVFCASLSDVFDPEWPPGVRGDLWRLIEATPALDWQLLTKRPEHVLRLMPAGGFGPNVWLGVSAEHQAAYDRRWPLLAALPLPAGAVRFVSYEPALGPLVLRLAGPLSSLPDWVIAGGESGPGARPMRAAWGPRPRRPGGRVRGSAVLQAVGRARVEPARRRARPVAGRGGASGSGRQRQGRGAARRPPRPAVPVPVSLQVLGSGFLFSVVAVSAPGPPVRIVVTQSAAPDLRRGALPRSRLSLPAFGRLGGRPRFPQPATCRVLSTDPGTCTEQRPLLCGLQTPGSPPFMRRSRVFDLPRLCAAGARFPHLVVDFRRVPPVVAAPFFERTKPPLYARRDQSFRGFSRGLPSIRCGRIRDTDGRMTMAPRTSS